MDNPFNELEGKKPEEAPVPQPTAPEPAAQVQTTIFDNPTPAPAQPTVVQPETIVAQQPEAVQPAAPSPFDVQQPAPVQQPTQQPVQQQVPVQQPIQQPAQQGGVMMQNQQGGQPQFGQQQTAPAFGGGGNFGQEQQPFGGQQQQQQFGGQQPQQQQSKYHIIDMLWLINQKIVKKEQLQQNERHLLSVGINASFGNMRMTFYDAGGNAFTPSSIIIANATRKTVANAYPEACNEVLSNKDNGKTTFLFERVIRADNRWVPNQTGITWTANKITIQSMDSQNNQSLFDIVDWQVEAFEKALRFMTTGGGWLASLQGTINR